MRLIDTKTTTLFVDRYGISFSRGSKWIEIYQPLYFWKYGFEITHTEFYVQRNRAKFFIIEVAW